MKHYGELYADKQAANILDSVTKNPNKDVAEFASILNSDKFKNPLEEIIGIRSVSAKNKIGQAVLDTSSAAVMLNNWKNALTSTVPTFTKAYITSLIQNLNASRK